MNSQFTYVDANNSYVVARLPNEHDVSASPRFINHSSNCVQQPVHNNLYASSFSNMQHMYPNPHSSATPQIHMPMNNMMISVNQVETSHVGTYNSMQQSVSSFYSSATNLQYMNQNMSVDRGIGHATTSYSANYPQPSYATPYVINSSASYATVDVHNSALHLHAHSRISGNPAGALLPSPNTVAYNLAPTQLHNFGDISLPEESNSVGGQSNEDWVEVGRKKLKDSIAAMFAEFRQEQAALRIKERKNNDSDKKRNSVIEKAESSNFLCRIYSRKRK